MAKFIDPDGVSSSNLPLEQLTQEAGIEPPKQDSFNFQKLIDILNIPSKKTEEFLVGERGYEGAGLPAPVAFGARMLLDPLNLIGGLGIGKHILKGIGAGAKLLGKVKPIGSLGRAAEELFVPGAKLKRVSPQLATELPALETATRAKQTQAVRKVGELGKGIPEEMRSTIGKLVEKSGQGVQLTPEELAAVNKMKEFIETGITAPEKASGIAPSQLADYFPRKAERDAVDNLLKFGGKRLSLGLGGAEKSRKFLTQEAGEAAGVIYKDPLEALAIRASKSEAARANAGFLKRLVGGEIKDVDGNSLIAPLSREGAEQGYKEFTIKSLKGFQAPTEAVDDIEKYYKTFISDDATNGLLKFYDSALGVWKGSVTSLFPAFHFRNALGNLSNMWLGGFKNPIHLVQAARIQKGESIAIKGTTVTKDLLEQLGVSGRGQFGADIPDVLGDVLGKKNILSRVNPFEIGRKAGTFVEDNAKTAFFLDRLAKGDNIPQAVAQVKKYLFDYTSLAPFEKDIMKRIVPFYTWMRNNIPLQIENLITQPGKQAAMAKLPNLASLTQEQQESLPPYLKEGLAFNLGETPTGESKVLSGIGLPFEDLARFGRGSIGRTAEKELLGSMGPVSNILGMLMNRDIFRGQSIDESGYSYGRAAKDYPEPIKQFLEFREETSKDGSPYYYVNPQKYQFLNLIAPRILRAIGDPATGLQVGRVREFNLQEEKEKTSARQLGELEKQLEQKGVLKKFEKYYIPKKGKTKFISPF